ncbi:unnamed protein product [Rangifer tarandus platyrhynchus]|uniref:Uncharacterized protein n=2 Tax=Rangifer tarandus platyrhynchus TaxID=3082113 RepID=A0ACB0FA18_RANTA|nr:unnamed protein product [Rangifer tarandus platyrhynchus]CAI9709930.1 unnamed protein product [Rangifer tarandus platyrhynchus]
MQWAGPAATCPVFSSAKGVRTNPDHRFHARTPVPEPQTRDRPQARRLRPPLSRTRQSAAEEAGSDAVPPAPRNPRWGSGGETPGADSRNSPDARRLPPSAPRPRRWRRTRPATRSPSGHLPHPAQVTTDRCGQRAPTAVTRNKPAVTPRAATRKCGRSPSNAHAPSRPRRETGPRAPPAGGAARGVRGQPPRPAGERLGSALARRTPQGCGVEDETPF